MKAEKIKRIEEIYHAALELSPVERAAFLGDACGADQDLLGEVESLLAFEEISGQFLDTPPVSLVADLLSEQKEKNELTIGAEIGHYKIKALLGKGGMGEVYLAEDTKLDRQVALKFLPPEFVRNEDRMSRFTREAKSASALNHPNIITIYEINEFAGAHFIATEFIDGQSLSRLLKSGPLSSASALEIAVQMALALDEAHGAGIVHRDIKPDNVMIRPNGLVKILDFGIAKPSEPACGASQSDPRDRFNAPAAGSDLNLTGSGTIIGTANYMSPEQAKGEAVDTRTDIFSFGVVFYEMLAGTLPFAGENSSDVIEAILHKEAKPLEKTEIAPEIEKIIDRCLRKNRDERYQTSRDLLDELKTAKRDLTAAVESGRTPRRTEKPAPATQSREAVTAGEIVIKKPTFYKFFASALLILFVCVGGFFGYRSFNPAKQIRSIAVLPFVNESDNKDVEYLSDGMTETLIRSLSNIPNLSIKARSTVFMYKGKDTTPSQIGRELQVDAVLIGRLVQRGDDLKLSLELVETTTQDVLWTENYERKMQGLVSLQSEIAESVSDKLRLRLTAAEQEQIAKTYTTNSEAQQLYLKGRFHWNKRNVRNFEKAIGYFRQAIEKDPGYALAYAGLADTFALMPLYGNFRPNQYMPEAKQAALKALELDADLAEAHASLGRIINSYDYDWNGAEREFKQAIRLNPNYPTVHQWYAELLAFSGRTDESLKEISKALELDPFSLTINRMKGNVLCFAEKHDEAIAQLNKTIELYPENALVRFNLGDVFAAKRMYAEAVEQYLIALDLDGQPPAELQKLHDAYQDKGWEGFWAEYLKGYLEERKNRLETDENAYLKNESLAFAYAAARNRDKALEYLNKAFEERDPELITLRMSGVYDFLNEDPRYKALLKKIGLPE